MKKTSVDFFHRLASILSLSFFGASGLVQCLSGTAFRVPTGELARRRHSSKRARVDAEGRGGKAKSANERNCRRRRSQPPLTLALPLGLSLSFLFHFLSLSLSLSRDPDHPRQRARCPRSNGTKPGRKRSHSSGETKLEEKVQRRPAIAPAPPAALNQRAKRARAASSLFLFYVPAASLAALGPVDRVPGVLHHGERTTKRKHERNVSLKGVVRRGERAAAAFFFFFFFPFFERASSRTHKKTRQAVRPTTLSRSFFFL